MAIMKQAVGDCRRRSKLSFERGANRAAALILPLSGAVFADLKKFPGAGAWHSSEVGPLFGTFERSTATPADITWSGTFQTAMANFVKDPTRSPAINWPKYIPGPSTKTLAKLAYNGNVDPENFGDPVGSTSLENPGRKTALPILLYIRYRAT
ncbi:hypothetical protein DFH09DRAFT_1462932 [Mycena vulgaris]|nr:hypothetical protein DFH09DRAFT_1462932 [Mycena vulgaris]